MGKNSEERPVHGLLLARLRKISKIISVGVEGTKSSKRRRHGVLLVLLFWLGALEFKILKFLFFCCLYIFLGNFPRFSTSEEQKFLEQRCDIFRLILHSWRLRFLSQLASACVPCSEKSFPAKPSDETSFKMDSILILTRLLENQKAPC